MVRFVERIENGRDKRYNKEGICRCGLGSGQGKWFILIDGLRVC